MDRRRGIYVHEIDKKKIDELKRKKGDRRSVRSRKRVDRRQAGVASKDQIQQTRNRAEMQAGRTRYRAEMYCLHWWCLHSIQAQYDCTSNTFGGLTSLNKPNIYTGIENVSKLSCKGVESSREVWSKFWW